MRSTHLAALALAPMSVVQVALAAGVVLIAVMADRLFGFEVGPRQRFGLWLIAAALFFALSALSCWYYLFYCLYFLMFHLLYLRVHEHRWPRGWRLAAPALCLA